MFNDLEACNELADSLQSRITNYEKTTKESSKIIAKQDEQMANLLNQVNLEKDMLDACDKAVAKKDRKIKFLKFTRTVAVCAAGLEAVYIGVKAMFK